MTTKIDKLTPEQEARFPEFRERCISNGLGVGRADRARAEAGAALAYKAAGLPFPKQIYWFDSPLAGVKKAAELCDKTASDMYPLASRGNHESGWVSYHSFFLEACGLEICEPIRGLMNVTESAGWWWPLDEAVVMTERPTVIRRDAGHRLHSATGPAMEYADGFALYRWHGLEVPKEWILNPASLKAETALSWPNIEQRRAAAEILGWAKILDALKAKSIDKDSDPQIGELFVADLPDSPGQKFLRVRCGTGRDFCLPVAPHLMTALAANAWTFGFEKAGEIESYRNYEVRT